MQNEVGRASRCCTGFQVAVWTHILQFSLMCQGFRDAETSSKARMLLKEITNSDFTVALSVLDKIIALLSLICYRSHCRRWTDLLQAFSSVSDLLEILKQKCIDADETFTDIWRAAEELAGFAGSELQTLRLVGRQCHRSNVPAASPIKYYRRTVYIPFIDSMIHSLKRNFQVITVLCQPYNSCCSSISSHSINW
jgi:hypothetical protein